LSLSLKLCVNLDAFDVIINPSASRTVYLLMHFLFDFDDFIVYHEEFIFIIILFNPILLTNL